METKDYIRIESALNYLTQRDESQPTLASYAAKLADGVVSHVLD